MNPKEAVEIYHCGPKVVVKALVDLSNEVNCLKKIVQSQQKTIAKLSKNSSNSSKPPSSDDITKPKSTKKKDKKRKIGGQKGHPIHERTAYPKEAIESFTITTWISVQFVAVTSYCYLIGNLVSSNKLNWKK